MGCSVDSNIADITIALPKPLTVPNAPSNVKAAPGSYITDKEAWITLTWTDNSDNEAEFKIYRQSPDGMWSYWTRTLANNIRINDVVYASGLYAYKVQACNTLGCSVFSAVATVNITLLAQPPPPTGATSTLSVSISANPSSGNAPLGGVDLIAAISGAAQGSANYTFYCNRSDADTNIISGYAAKYDGNYELAKTAIDICSYPTAGTYSAKVIVEKGGLAAESRATITVRELPPPVIVLYPNGGETFTQSKDNKVSWSGGKNKVRLGLVESNYNSKTGAVLGWINTNAQPASSLLWDAKELADLAGSTRWPVSPGSYKILAVSENASGDYCILNNSESCNYDVSDYPFTIAAPPADAVVKIITLDSYGKPVADAGVLIAAKDSSKSFSGATSYDGSFSVRITAGAYAAEVYVPAGRNDLVKPAPVEFSVARGETKEIKLQFGRLVKILSGAVTFTNKEPIPDAQVTAYNEGSGQWLTALTNSSGVYSMDVGPGKWMVGVKPVDPMAARWRAPSQYQYVEFGSDSSAETKTINFVVPSADAKINVHTVDSDGRALPYADVVLDMRGAAEPQSPNQPTVPPEFRKTDSAGLAVFLSLPGLYYIRASLPAESGFINPPEQIIQIVAHETKEINLVFRKKEVVAATTINGVIKLDSGIPVDASVGAWSEKGGSVRGKSGADGMFSLQVSFGEKWHIGAAKEVSGFPYKSSEVIIDANSASMAIELVLIKTGAAPLPKSISVSQDASQPAVAQLTDRMKLVMPAGAAALSGTITMDVRPTTEAPSQPAAKVVSTVYDVQIKDQKGERIKKLNNDVELVIPYNEDDLKAHGVTEEMIVPSYFDETAGIWIKADNYTIDKKNNVAVVRLKHLTRFALVSAADIAPPAAPTSISAKQVDAGKALFRWTNPSRDFAYVKIYRSTRAGVLGNVAFAETPGDTQTDGGLKTGVKYYYTIRAVDPAGNESVNTNQVSITLAEAVQAPVIQTSIGQFNKNLSFGMTNSPDVKMLQELLTNLGIYSGPVTGSFFTLTKAAVMNFQSAYAAEVLKPAGLDKPTGYVGALTRAKLNLLATQPAAAAPTKAVGVAQKQVRQITRMLSYGLKNDEEVKLLQEWLTRLGIYSGPITGNFFALTEQAVAMFQMQRGLPGGGYIGPETQAELNKLFAQ